VKTYAITFFIVFQPTDRTTGPNSTPTFWMDPAGPRLLSQALPSKVAPVFSVKLAEDEVVANSNRIETRTDAQRRRRQLQLLSCTMMEKTTLRFRSSTSKQVLQLVHLLLVPSSLRQLLLDLRTRPLVPLVPRMLQLLHWPDWNATGLQLKSPAPEDLVPGATKGARTSSTTTTRSTKTTPCRPTLREGARGRGLILLRRKTNDKIQRPNLTSHDNLH
jgi:hypothetical protein